jgi:hypothetical protein
MARQARNVGRIAHVNHRHDPGNITHIIGAAWLRVRLGLAQCVYFALQPIDGGPNLFL